MASSSQLPPFQRLYLNGRFLDTPIDIELTVCGFNFLLHTEELLQYSPKMFSTPPNTSHLYETSYYIGRVNNAGNWLFFPLDEACDVPPEWQVPDERYKERYLDMFVAFVNVIYNRSTRFQSMGHVRSVFRMCRSFGALPRFAEYMNFRFIAEHEELLSTLHMNPIGNINMAEEIHHRVMYAQCFTLLAGRIAEGNLRNLTNVDRAVSLLTQQLLMEADDRLFGRYEGVEASADRLMCHFKKLVGDTTNHYIHRVVDSYAKFCEDIDSNHRRSPENYRRLLNIVESIERNEYDLLQGAPKDMLKELWTCKRWIDMLLENRLLYHPTSDINFFACMTMSEYPWLLDI